jgi:hypothetical protein
MTHTCRCSAFTLPTATSSHCLTVRPGLQELHTPTWCAAYKRQFFSRDPGYGLRHYKDHFARAALAFQRLA